MLRANINKLFFHVPLPNQLQEQMSNCDSSDTSEGSGFLGILLSWCCSHQSLFLTSVPNSLKQARFRWTTCYWLHAVDFVPFVFVLFLYGKAEQNKEILGSKLNVVIYLIGVAGKIPFYLIAFFNKHGKICYSTVSVEALT